MIGLKKEVTSNLIREEVRDLQRKGFSRGRPVQLNRAAKLLSLSNDSAVLKSGRSSVSLESLHPSSLSSPAVVLSDIFADYEKLMALQSNSVASRRIGRKLCIRLFNRVRRMKDLLSERHGSTTTSDIPEVGLIEKAMEQIHLLLLQQSSDIPNHLLTSQICQAIPHHSKANRLFFTSLAGIGDFATACRRFRREDKSVFEGLFQLLERHLKLSDNQRLLLTIRWMSASLLEDRVSSSREWREIAVDDLLRAAQTLANSMTVTSPDPSSSASSISQALKREVEEVTSSPSSSFVFPASFHSAAQTSSTLRRGGASLILLRSLYCEAERFGLAQMKYTAAALLADQLIAMMGSDPGPNSDSPAPSLLSALREGDAALFSLFDAARWEEEVRSFLRDCAKRCSMNILACKVKRLTKPPTPPPPPSAAPSASSSSASSSSSLSGKRGRELSGEGLARVLLDSSASQMMSELVEGDVDKLKGVTSRSEFHMRLLSLLSDLQRFADLQHNLTSSSTSISTSASQGEGVKDTEDSRRREEVRELIALLHQQQRSQQGRSVGPGNLPDRFFDFQFRQTADVFHYLFTQRMRRRAAKRLSSDP